MDGFVYWYRLTRELDSLPDTEDRDGNRSIFCKYHLQYQGKESKHCSRSCSCVIFVLWTCRWSKCVGCMNSTTHWHTSLQGLEKFESVSLVMFFLKVTDLRNVFACALPTEGLGRSKNYHTLYFGSMPCWTVCMLLYVEWRRRAVSCLWCAQLDQAG